MTIALHEIDMFDRKGPLTAEGLEDSGDGYAAALTNFKFISSGVLTTDEAADLISG